MVLAQKSKTAGRIVFSDNGQNNREPKQKGGCAVKAASFAVGIAAGALLGAAASAAAEAYMPYHMRRDLSRKARKGVQAMGHMAENVNPFGRN